MPLEDQRPDFQSEMNGYELSYAWEEKLWTKMSWEALEEGWEAHEDDYLADGEYHLYEIEWTPAYLSLSVDG